MLFLGPTAKASSIFCFLDWHAHVCECLGDNATSCVTTQDLVANVNLPQFTTIYCIFFMLSTEAMVSTEVTISRVVINIRASKNISGLVKVSVTSPAGLMKFFLNVEPCVHFLLFKSVTVSASACIVYTKLFRQDPCPHGNSMYRQPKGGGGGGEVPLSILRQRLATHCAHVSKSKEISSVTH